MTSNSTSTTAATGRGSDQFVLRLPAGLRTTLKTSAAQARRSLNAEIISLIERGITISPAPDGMPQACIADQIRVARSLSGLSLAAVGEHLGVSAQAVHAWEMGGAFPSHQNLLSVSALLGVKCGPTIHRANEIRTAVASARPDGAVLHELLLAETIICAMLGIMTTSQKVDLTAKLEELGVAGEGATRFHERRTAITAARGAA